MSEDGTQYIIVETSEYNDYHNVFVYKYNLLTGEWDKVIARDGSIEEFTSLDHIMISTRVDRLGTHTTTAEYRLVDGELIQKTEMIYFIYYDYEVNEPYGPLTEGQPVPDEIEGLETIIEVPTTIGGKKTSLSPGTTIYPYGYNEGVVYYLLQDGTRGMFYYTDTEIIEGINVIDCFKDMETHYAG